ncbi:polysaccharide deacetylase family protein [Actinomadura atramentaria]|uniref:polysaccharide deacetylase family protein n=1 Tax=Actinomadura atramentaria TaxID=1990 RepID=UPI00037E55F2|nr:polysaccharide deacetylase family protein [Actinomadura atramentaria]
MAALLTGAVGLTAVAGCGDSRSERAAARGRAVVAGQQPRAKAPDAPPGPRSIDCGKVACVALTFDDGPGPYTETLLNELHAANARATFFMLGENVGHFPNAVHRMAMEGHELANHSWSHPQLTTMSSADVRSQVQRTQEAIRKASGGVTPKLMRPPYGAVNKRVNSAIGMPEVLWSVDTLDWKYRDTARAEKVAVKEAHRGGIILFHDIHKTSVAAVPTVLDGLKKKGLTPVTVSELYSTDKPLQAGVAYAERMPPAPPKPAEPVAPTRTVRPPSKSPTSSTRPSSTAKPPSKSATPTQPAQPREAGGEGQPATADGDTRH